MNPIWKIVTDADAEMLMGDEAKRQLYADLVEYTIVPGTAPGARKHCGHQDALGVAVQHSEARQDAAGAQLNRAGRARAHSTRSSLTKPFTPCSFRRCPPRDACWRLVAALPDHSGHERRGKLRHTANEGSSGQERARTVRRLQVGKGTLAGSAYMAGDADEETAVVDT